MEAEITAIKQLGDREERTIQIVLEICPNHMLKGTPEDFIRLEQFHLGECDITQKGVD